jgi:hypothetical protein
MPGKEWMVTIRLSDWKKFEAELLAQEKKITQLIVTHWMILRINMQY